MSKHKGHFYDTRKPLIIANLTEICRSAAEESSATHPLDLIYAMQSALDATELIYNSMEERR